MATFTMELWKVLEHTNDIGLNDYPLFDESYRGTLNQKIIDHYLNQEIGMETISMFRLAVRRRMNEIMPLYNQHYAANQIKFDPLLTVDVKNLQASEGVANAESASDTTSDGTSKTRVVNSTTPQTLLSDTGEYADGAQDSISNTVASANSTDNSSTTQNAKVDGSTKGFQGSAAMMMMQYRASFVNTDLEIIEALSDCFMGLWSNGDEFSPAGGMNYGGYIYGRYGFGLRFF